MDIASSSFAKLIARPDNNHRSSGEHLSTTTVCLGSINQSNQERFPYGDISEYDMSIWAVVAVSDAEVKSLPKLDRFEIIDGNDMRIQTWT